MFNFQVKNHVTDSSMGRLIVFLIHYLLNSLPHTHFRQLFDDFFYFAVQWRIQNFPDQGAPTAKVANLLINQFFQTLCENEKIFGWIGGGGRMPHVFIKMKYLLK